MDYGEENDPNLHLDHVREMFIHLIQAEIFLIINNK